MANKVIPIRKAPLKPGVVATARRSLVLMAGEVEISVEITAEARRRTASADPNAIQSAADQATQREGAIGPRRLSSALRSMRPMKSAGIGTLEIRKRPRGPAT